MRTLPSSSLTVPDVQISRFRPRRSFGLGLFFDIPAFRYVTEMKYYCAEKREKILVYRARISSTPPVWLLISALLLRSISNQSARYIGPILPGSAAAGAW